MKWLVTGASGLLGSDLVRLLRAERPTDEIITPTRGDLDLCRLSEIPAFLERTRPQVIVNCAAWTDVDGAEGMEAQARLINAAAPEVMAKKLATSGDALFVHVSTDYVFDGQCKGTYAEIADASPLSAYGRTKLEGEEAVRAHLPERSLVLRTAWLYGPRGANFAKRVIDQLKSGSPVNAVVDQWGHPTFTSDASRRMLELSLAHALRGVRLPSRTFHVVNSGTASWWDFAREIADQLGYADVPIGRIESATLERAATRPTRVELQDNYGHLVGLPPTRPWQEALASALPLIGGWGA